MSILKTMRNKIGLSQQDMANLLGVTRQQYSMVETGKRTLPAEAALRFAAILPVLMADLPQQTLPTYMPDVLRSEIEQQLNRAKQDLFIAEKALKACIEEVQQHQHLHYFLGEISKLTELQLTSRGQQLVNQLIQEQQHTRSEYLLGRLRISQAQVDLCQRAVVAYSEMLHV